MLGSLVKGTSQTSPLRLLLSPSVLLTSVKSWLCIIFSTISSASILVSSTRVGWLSIESFFLLARGNTGKNLLSFSRHGFLHTVLLLRLSGHNLIHCCLKTKEQVVSLLARERCLFLTGRVCPAGGVVWGGEVASPVCVPAPPQGTPRSCWAPRRRCCWWRCSGGASGPTCWRSASAPCCNLPTHRNYRAQLLPFLAAQLTGRAASQQLFCPCTQSFRAYLGDWTGTTEQGERDGCKSLSQVLVAGRKRGGRAVWISGYQRSWTAGWRSSSSASALSGKLPLGWTGSDPTPLGHLPRKRGHCWHHNQGSTWCTDQLGVEADLGMTDQGKASVLARALLYKPAQG